MPPTDVAREVVDLERRYWQAIKDRDVKAALDLTDNPCIIAGASGVATVDRDSFAKIMDAAQYELHAFKIEDDVQVREVSDGVMVLAYKVIEDLTVEGKPLTLHAADSSVWVRRDGAWRCALHTESVLGDSYGRDRKT